MEKEQENRSRTEQVQNVMRAEGVSREKSDDYTGFADDLSKVILAEALHSFEIETPIELKNTTGSHQKDDVNDTPKVTENKDMTNTAIVNTSNNKPLQRVIEGDDPVSDSNILDVAHINDLLYGLTNYRGATMNRMNESTGQKRTVDQYNTSVGLTGELMHNNPASISIYVVRAALENPSQWKLPNKAVNYPNDNEIKAYINGSGTLSNEQKWMTFLVREKHNIGLWDLGNTNRSVIGHNVFGRKQRGEAEGLNRIKSKRRFEKNINESDGGKFTEKEVNMMLSFGTDIDAATNYYLNALTQNQREGLNNWIEQAFWRRTSKLGIDFATSKIGLNARVHFNLTSGVRQNDGNWKARLYGIINDIAKDQGKRKITDSEWRYIIRMADENPDLVKNIIPYSEHQ